MISGITPSLGGASSTAINDSSNILGKDDFLTLLIAQLGAQDPLDPLSGQDFSAQLAQFSALEQMTNMNATLENLIIVEIASSNAATIGLIGKLVDVEGNSFEYTGEGSVNLNYSLDQNADSVTVQIFDSGGNLVTTLDGQTETGNHLIAWDGLNSSGEASASGAYTFEVTALDFDGDALSVETFTTGLVTDVLFEETGAFALVNGEKIPVGEITRVSLNI